MNRRGFIGIISASTALAGCATLTAHNAGLEMAGGDYLRPWMIVGVQPVKLYDRPQPQLLFYDGPLGTEAAESALNDAQRAFKEGKVAGWFKWSGRYYQRRNGLP